MADYTKRNSGVGSAFMPTPDHERGETHVGGFGEGWGRGPHTSRRDSERSGRPLEGVPYGYERFRDSGYDSSSRIARQSQPPLWPINVNPPAEPSSDPPHAPSQFPIHEQETEQFDQDDNAPGIDLYELRSPDSIPSHISAELPFAPDFKEMPPHTPPPSDTSLNTYFNRFRQFVHEVKSLPWVAKERVTEDYYPGASSPRLHRRFRHHPAISWHSQEYDQHNYHLAFGISGPPTSADSSPTPEQYKALLPRPFADLDLGEEFNDLPGRGQTPAAAPPAQLPPPVNYPIYPGGLLPGDGFPRYPGGYVHSSEQNFGMQYGAPIRMTQPSVMMVQPIYGPMPPGAYYPVQ
ncbi:hypothetical protein K443DRAFT_686167 [Laccaria amethystina LaAM-08-1]|uniref:Uncharacterized protein n=1 Tax=Laccaria amethystina LaAM-08-1 TaxID=1095629 RepID=A0A0C9WMN8_9AGAR|nr:hypothetical protein K443DRAFT_686167 [Laccaria amethystina LaAM-08-1]